MAEQAAPQFSFEVHAPQTVSSAPSFSVTVRVPIANPTQASAILHYMRSIQMKHDFMHGWVRQNAPNYGMEMRGGPRPVFETPNDRNTKVLAYEQDIRLTRPV